MLWRGDSWCFGPSPVKHLPLKMLSCNPNIACYLCAEDVSSQLFLTELRGPRATLLPVSTMAMALGSLRAPRLPCLDPSEEASVDKTYFQMGVLGRSLVQGASPLFSLAHECCPAGLVGRERLRGREGGFGTGASGGSHAHCSLGALPSSCLLAGGPKPQVVIWGRMYPFQALLVNPAILVWFESVLEPV